MGVLVWSPLASGWLSGAIREGQEVSTNRSGFMQHRFDVSVPANRAKLDAVEQLAKVADSAGLTMIQLALGFVTAHPGVTSALIGPRTIDHLHSQITPGSPRDDTTFLPTTWWRFGALTALAKGFSFKLFLLAAWRTS
jgi:aryl-alcohol dehydrogenase-like predicted oxidoreductase